MTTEEKEKVYQSIVDEYLHPRIKSMESEFDTVLHELFNKDQRSVVIIGVAYLEELCKKCFLETMLKKNRKKFIDKHSRELTFSLTFSMLFAQDYLSREIFDLIDSLRRIRNTYAHTPILKKSELESIKGLNENMRKIINKRWMTRNLESIKKNPDVDAQLYLIVLENLIFGLIGLEMWINPFQKLCRLQFIKEETFLRLNINIGEISSYTEGYFREKFKKSTEAKALK